MSELPSDVRFPYMVFARASGGGAPYSLIQSGMPPPDARLLGAEPPDLGFAGEALERLQGMLAAHLDVLPERVILTVGASSGMLLAGLTFFRGARVAVEVPCYQPLRVLPELCGGSLRPFERRAEEGHALDPDRVRRSLAGGPGPGHVFLTTPHNPSGAVDRPEDLRAAARAAADEGGLLIANEVYLEYAPLELRRRALPSAVHLAPNTLSIGSFTKAYGLGALRLGWLVLGDDLAGRRAQVEDAAFLDYVDPATPILRLGIRALENLSALRAPYERFVAECKPRLARWMAATPGVEGRMPEHGLIAFPRLVGIDDTLAFQRLAVRDHGVDFVPGEYFGAPGHVRLGFGLEPPALDEALVRLTRAVRSQGS